MKNAENKLVDELFDVVKGLIDKELWKINVTGVRFSGLMQFISQWTGDTKKNFIIDTPEQEWMSFATACVHHKIVSYLGSDLRNAVQIMAGSSSLEEIKLKFIAAGLIAV